MSRTHTLTLTEGGPSQLVDIADATIHALLATGVITATRTATPGTWEVAASNVIGVVAAGDVQISVLPKVSIDRIVFMLGFARHPRHWLDTNVDLEQRAELPEALAHALVRHARTAMWRGILQGYRVTEESSSVLRGRIRDADQIRRRFGRLVPLEVVYDDYTVDVTENQMVLSAAIRLLRAPTLRAETRRELRRLRVLLAEVTPLAEGAQLPTWTINRLNQRYAPVLTVADLVLRANSFDQRLGTIPVSGFLVSMPRLFEDFVCTTLGSALERYGGRARPQWRGHLDVARAVPIRPDLVWELHGSPRVVVDAKYKVERPAGFPHADLYQMLAYCTVLGTSDGHLVYARGEKEPTEHDVLGAHVRVHCHALDLSSPPAEVVAQLERIAEHMLRLALSRPGVDRRADHGR